MSLYDDLGVLPDADQDAIKKAYRKSAQRAHPDKAGGSKEKFHAVQRAYEVLSDESARQRYDKTGKENKDDPEQEAIRVLVEMFLTFVEKGDPDHDDLVALVAAASKAKIGGLNQEIAEVRITNRKLERTAKRIRHKLSGKTNFLVIALELRIARNQKRIASLEESIALGRRILELLQDFEYLADPRDGTGGDMVSFAALLENAFKEGGIKR